MLTLFRRRHEQIIDRPACSCGKPSQRWFFVGAGPHAGKWTSADGCLTSATAQVVERFGSCWDLPFDQDGWDVRDLVNTLEELR